MKKNKKKIIIACIIVAAVIAAAAITAVTLNKNKVYSLADAGIENIEDVSLISHRGLNVYAPENTVEAAQKAAEYGYKQVEFDIRLSKDGVWVLMHDEDISRTTNGKGRVSELTYKQLLSFRVDSDSKKDIVVIPSLEEMLAACARLGLEPVIEIKQEGTDFIKDLLNFIGYRSGNCTVITFSREQAEEIAKHLKAGDTSLFDKQVKCYWLVSELNDEVLETAKSDTFIGISFNGNKTENLKQLKKFTDANTDLATWTIDKPDLMNELYSLGIRTFTSNRITPDGVPEETTSEVDENGQR